MRRAIYFQAMRPSRCGARIMPAGNTVVTPSLVLSYDDASEVFSWTWNGTDPVYWELMPTGSTDYLDDSVYQADGTARAFTSTVEGFFYLVGIDADLNAVTPASNAIKAGF